MPTAVPSTARDLILPPHCISTTRNPGSNLETIPFSSFSPEVVRDVAEVVSEFKMAAEHLRSLALSYCQKQGQLAKLGHELGALYEEIADKDWDDQPKKSKQRIGEILEEIESCEALIEKDLSGLGLKSEPAKMREDHVLELAYPYITERTVEKFLKPHIESLVQILTSPETMLQLNYNCLRQDGIAGVCERAYRNKYDRFNQQEFIAELGGYLRDKIDQMTFGIDVSYAKDEQQRQEAVERMDRVSNFEMKYGTSLPYPSFTYGRMSRRPNDDYKPWAETLGKKFLKDAIASISEAVKEVSRDRDSHYVSFESHSTSYLGYGFPKYNNGFHQLESMLDLLGKAEVLDKATIAGIRSTVAMAAIDGIDSAYYKSTIGLELRNLNRQPEFALAGVVKYLEREGHKHQFGPVGSNHDTTAFAQYYQELLAILKHRNQVHLLEQTLSPIQYRLATDLANPTMLRENTDLANLPFYVANPKLALFLTDAAEEFSDLLGPIEIQNLLLGRINDLKLVSALLKCNDFCEMFGQAGLDTTKTRDQYSFALLLRNIACSPELTGQMLSGIAAHSPFGTENQRILCEAVLNTAQAQTVAGRLALISDLMENCAQEDPELVLRKFEEILEKPKKVESATEKVRVKTDIGQLIIFDWDSKTEILLIGEEHTNKAQVQAQLEALDDLVQSGMADLALELPIDFEEVIDQFLVSEDGLVELSEALEAHLKEEPWRIDMFCKLITQCKANGISVHCIDLHSNELSFMETLSRFSQVEVEKGSTNHEQLNHFYFRRNLNMARRLALLKEINPSTGLVFSGGALHLSTRIADTSIGSLLLSNDKNSRSVELIGGEQYELTEVIDPRFNAEVFRAKSDGRSAQLYKGENSDGTFFVHLPQV